MSKLSIAPQDLSHKEMGKTTEEANSECFPCKFSIESGEVSHEKLGQMAEKAKSEGKFSIEFPDEDASHEKLYRIMKKLQEFSKESGVEFRNFKIFSRREDSTEVKLDEDRTDDFNKTYEKTEALQEKPPTESKGENKRKREPEPEPQSRTKIVKEENNPTAA